MHTDITMRELGLGIATEARRGSQSSVLKGITLSSGIQAGMGPDTGISPAHISSERGKGENTYTRIRIDGVATTYGTMKASVMKPFHDECGIAAESLRSCSFAITLNPTARLRVWVNQQPCVYRIKPSCPFKHVFFSMDTVNLNHVLPVETLGLKKSYQWWIICRRLPKSNLHFLNWLSRKLSRKIPVYELGN